MWFLGLDAAAWTAIGTVGLVLATFALVGVTAAYVRLTGRLARHAETTAKAAQSSAASAERAAEATREAAEATRQAAAVAQAQLPVQFEVQYFALGPSRDPVVWLSAQNKGATVFLHGLTVESAVVHFPGEDEFTVLMNDHRRAEPREGTQPPQRLHREEHALFDWPYKRVDLGRFNAAWTTLEYSVERTGEKRTKREPIGFPSTPAGEEATPPRRRRESGTE